MAALRTRSRELPTQRRLTLERLQIGYGQLERKIAELG